MTADERHQAEQALLDEIFARYPYLRFWLTGIGPRRMHGLIIMQPQHVIDAHHRIVHDHELRERARPIIHPDRTNKPGDNAVLVIAPLQ